jgi:hypothetical protein
MKHTSVSSASPGRGWKLIAKRPIKANGREHPVGSEIQQIEWLGKNFQAFFDGHFVAWVPPTTTFAAAPPKELPRATPAKARPKVTIIEASDVRESWILTRDSVRRLVDNNAALAEDILMQSPEARQLYLAAQKAACEAERLRLSKLGIRKVSVCPTDLPVPL